MPKRRILDEFSDLPVSHQRKSQLRNRKRGLCEICGQPRDQRNDACSLHRERTGPKDGKRGLRRAMRREFLRHYIERQGLPKGATRALVAICGAHGIKTNNRTIALDLKALGFRCGNRRWQWL